MKKTKTPIQLNKNASKLHRYIGELLTSEGSLFRYYEIRQEYNVSKINPDYSSNREKFDWVILGLNVVIEIHGKQHYEPVCFGGITKNKAKRNFLRRLQLDQQKQKAAKEAMWAYVVVKHNETNITLNELTARIHDAIEQVTEGIYTQQKPKAKIQSKSFQRSDKKHQWPIRKIPNRKFSNQQVQIQQKDKENNKMTERKESKCNKCNKILGIVDPRTREYHIPKNLLCSDCYVDTTTLEYKIDNLTITNWMDVDTEEICIRICDLNSGPTRAITIIFPYDALYKVAEAQPVPVERIKGALNTNNTKGLQLDDMDG